MGRITSNRKTAEALRKTLQQLESDPSVDPSDPAFVNLKCGVLQRVMDLELDTAETQASIHLVESPQPQPQNANKDEDKSNGKDTATA